MRPREGARSNPPPADLYSERLQDLPSGFRRWKVSMHWGRIKSRREAIQTIIGVVSFSLILHFAIFVLLCGVGSPFHCLPPAPPSWTPPSLPQAHIVMSFCFMLFWFGVFFAPYRILFFNG